MINVLAAPVVVVEAFIQVVRERLRHIDAGSARCTVEVVADELGPSLPRRL